MRVLVCGSRDLPGLFDHDRIWDALDALDREERITLLIHGAARGTDRCAGRWAETRAVPVQQFPADWARLGRAAGPIRNRQMLDEGKPDLIVAFPGRRGTADMVRQAESAGVPVTLIEAPSRPAAAR